MSSNNQSQQPSRDSSNSASIANGVTFANGSVNDSNASGSGSRSGSGSGSGNGSGNGSIHNSPAIAYQAGENVTSSNGTTNGTTTTTTTSGKRRFLWHLRRPFKSMSRTLTDFHIMPKEPHKAHAPGDVIEGHVVLVTEKPIRITHLTVALHGYVRVFKTTTAVRDSVDPPTGLSSVQYHGNGYASLFQDEQVLCGEGKLERGRYQFGFSLLFPSNSLPSSINFERGTICYDIVATLVRPTALDAKLQCNREVILLEKIDIGTVRTPKAKSIVLEPISKSRKKHRKRLNAGLEKAPSIEKSVSFDQRTHTPEAVAGGALPDTEDVESIQQSVISEDQRPTGPSEQGDLRSELSAETGTGSNGTGTGTTTGTGTGASFRVGEGSAASNTGSGTPTNSHISIKAASTIRADLELTKGGFLPGDTVTVKVSVQHNRRMKSMHGIIVTLFRQTRIDTSPLASLFNPTLTKDQYKKLLNEENSPKSKTGLGGLSLSSTSSISIFRKDLQQNVLPLIINPVTLDYSVPVTIRIPESVFPTISNVPGEMVSFRYYLEVVLDLGGRLSNQFQSGATSSTLLNIPRAPISSDMNSHSTQGNMIAPVDTSHLRREKGVIADWFEVIIGTTDSARDAARRAKAKVQAAQAQVQAEMEAQAQLELQTHSSQHAPSMTSQDGIVASLQHDSKRPMPPPVGEPSASSLSAAMRPPPPPINEQAPRYVPAPQIVDDSALTEKERIRRHEQILLPSHAPMDDESSIAGPSSAASPSAPPEDDIYGLEDSNIAPIPVPRSANMEPSAPTLEDLEAPYEAPPPHDPQASSSSYASPLSFSRHPSAPTHAAPAAPPAAIYQPAGPSSSSAGPSSLALEDKQELERLRLLGEASRPPELPEDCDADAGEGSSRSSAPPQASAPSHPASSAPDLDGEADGFGYDESDPANPRHYFHSYAPTANGNDQLPAYER